MPVSECKACGNVTPGEIVAWCAPCKKAQCVRCGLNIGVANIKCSAGHKVNRADKIK